MAVLRGKRTFEGWALLGGVSLLALVTAPTQGQAPAYSLACIEPAEGETGLWVGKPNLGNRLDLFFLDASANLLSSSTVSPRWQGKPLGAASIAGNGLLYAQGETHLYLNRRLSQLSVAALSAALKASESHWEGDWMAVLGGPNHDARIRSALDRFGLDKHQRLRRHIPHAAQVGQARQWVSPNGDAVCFHVSLSDDENRGSQDVPLGYAVFVVERLGGDESGSLIVGREQRSRMLAPSWSPDGRYLAFYCLTAEVARAVDAGTNPQARVEGWQLCVADVHSGKIQAHGTRSCTVYPAPGRPPQWSPDRTRILSWASFDPDPARAERYPTQAIILTDLETGQSERLSTSRGTLEVLSWAPSGDRYLFFSSPPPGQDYPWLYKVGALEPREEHVVLDASRRDVRHEIAWSPDAKYLAYCSVTKTDAGWSDGITVIEASGNGPSREIVRSKPHTESLSRRYHNLTWLHLPRQ